MATLVKATLITEQGQKIAERNSQSIGPFISKITAHKLLERSRTTIDAWDRLLLKNPWYRAARKDVAKRLKREVRLPFHPFQYALLKELDAFQYKGDRNPQANKEEWEIADHIAKNSELWTLPNWEAGVFGKISL